jgi:hypothetical protein
MTVVVVVEGGCVQEIIADGEVDAILHDRDDEKAMAHMTLDEKEQYPGPMRQFTVNRVQKIHVREIPSRLEVRYEEGPDEPGRRR